MARPRNRWILDWCLILTAAVPSWIFASPRAGLARASHAPCRELYICRVLETIEAIEYVEHAHHFFNLSYRYRPCYLCPPRAIAVGRVLAMALHPNSPFDNIAHLSESLHVEVNRSNGSVQPDHSCGECSTYPSLLGPGGVQSNYSSSGRMFQRLVNVSPHLKPLPRNMRITIVDGSSLTAPVYSDGSFK